MWQQDVSGLLTTHFTPLESEGFTFISHVEGVVILKWLTVTLLPIHHHARGLDFEPRFQDG
jgi:hypothetical protein